MSEVVNRKCGKCGSVSLNKNDKFCIKCGAVLPKIPIVEPAKPIVQDNQKYCSNCGFTVNDLNEKFCINCGQPIRISQVQSASIKNSIKKYCSNCGKEIIDKPEIKFCKSCGKPIIQVNVNKEPEKSDNPKNLKESDVDFDESIGEPLIKKEIFSIPKMEDILDKSENKSEYQPVPKQGLIPKSSPSPAPSTIPSPIKSIINIPQKITTIPQLNIPEEQKNLDKKVDMHPEVAIPEPKTEKVEILPEVAIPEPKTEKVEILPEVSIPEPKTEKVEILPEVAIPEPKTEKEWKKIKIAICPKCDRHCRIVGAELIENEEWIPLNDVKKIEDGKYLVECPGCGVFFIADINMAVPCFEERY